MNANLKALATAGAAIYLMLGQAARVHAAPVSASGGDAVYDILVDGDIPYRVHVFTNTVATNFSVAIGGLVECLVVGGGGGGGGDLTASGGGGGVVFRRVAVTNGQPISVTVGVGGAGSATQNAGLPGEASLFGDVAAYGGGGRGADGGDGASGSGSSGRTANEGHAIDYAPYQGHDGGVRTGSYGGGGGGGAGGTGGGAGTAADVGGNGGTGLDYSRIAGDGWGEDGWFGGGGGGCSYTYGTEKVGLGGRGGGGVGGSRDTAAEHGAPSSGGGGGGGGNGSPTHIGGNGGSGIVIVRYPLVDFFATFDSLVLANTRTGSQRFTNTNEADIVAFPVPDGYDQFQFADENGSSAAINPEAWQPTNGIPSLLSAPVSFTLPAADTNVVLYAWFTNTTDAAAPLFRAAGEIFYTTEPPVPVVHSPLARAIAEGRSSVALTLAEIDNGSAGGTANGTAMDVYGTPVLSCPQDQTPEEAYVTLDAVGTFDVTLTLTNEAGNVASAVSEVSVAARGAALYVSLDGDQSTGTDWASAYTNIHDAFTAAVSNDTIHLAGQTFELTSQLVWTQSFVRLLGGYAATNAAEQPGPRDPERWPTIITRNPAYNTRLLYISGARDSELGGVTFADGHPVQPLDISGGGAVVAANAVNLLVRDCLFTNNYIFGIHNSLCYGGALHVVNSSGMISNTLLIANETHGRAGVGYGGAINVSGGAMHLRDVVVLANRVRGEWASEPWRVGYGGGLSFHGGSHSLSNALLFLNQSRRHVVLTATEGSGIYVWNNATVAIANATVAGHSSDGLHIVSGNVTVRNSILAGNAPDIGGGGTLAVSHSLVGDGTGGGTVGILSGDPVFDEEWFYLAPGSPCRNSGLGTVAAAGLAGYTVSTNGAAETAGAVVSMGYHYPPGAALEPFSEVYVSSDAGDDEAAGDATHPFRTITRALQASTGRLRVHLLPGVFDDAAEFPLRVNDRATLQIVGADPQTTVIDGKNAANKRLFEFIRAFGNNIIGGVTLRGAGGAVPAFDGIRAGGALHLSRSRLTIADCIVTNNRATVGLGAITLGIQTVGGGAIGAKQAALDICGTRFAGNTTTWGSSGGAILAHAVVGSITDCAFSNNLADAQTGPNAHNRSMSGGALHLGRSSMEIRDCRFTKNKAISHQNGNSAGGAVFHCDGRVAARNCIFADNQITNNYIVYPLYGAAVYQHNPGYLSAARTSLAFENCTVVGNFGDGGVYGHGLYGHDAYSRVVNTILFANLPYDFTNLTAAAFSHCRADRLAPGAQGNITVDPLLIDADAGNYGLQTRTGQYTAEGGPIQRYGADSPCIDAGTNLLWMVGATDLRGFPRRSHGLPMSGGAEQVDMGAFEVLIPPPGSLFMVR